MRRILSALAALLVVVLLVVVVSAPKISSSASQTPLQKVVVAGEWVVYGPTYLARQAALTRAQQRAILSMESALAIGISYEVAKWLIY